MSESGTLLHDVAVRMWNATAASVAQDATDVVGERLFTTLEAGLRRWIGAEGYASLLARAAAEVLPQHPALASVPNLIYDESALPETTSADNRLQRLALLALLVAMMRQLGGIIGEPLAVRLIEQSGTPSSHGPAGEPSSERPS